jgi:hypothetical protein
LLFFDYIKGIKNDSTKLDSVTIDLVDYKDMFISDYSLYKATKNTIVSNVEFEYDDEYIYVIPHFLRSDNSSQKMRYETKLKRFIIFDEQFCKFIGIRRLNGHFNVS